MKIVNGELVELNIKIAFKKVNKNSSIYGKLISLKTNSKYIHTEVIIEDKWISSVIGQGVHIKELKPLKDTYDYKDIKVTITKEQYYSVMTWIYKQENKKYDKIGILFSQTLPMRLDSRDKWFCSELTTKILQLLLVKEVMDLLPHLQSPGDLAKIFNME